MHRFKYIVAALGLCATPGFAQATHDSTSPTRGSITVRAAGRTIVFAPAELATFARVAIRTPGPKPGDSSTVSGVGLWDLLERVGAPGALASGRQRAVMSVVLTGRDSQRAIVALAEADPSFASHTIVLADRRDGKLLDTVEGAWRAITPGDRRHARWIRDVVEIEVHSLPVR